MGVGCGHGSLRFLASPWTLRIVEAKKKPGRRKMAAKMNIWETTLRSAMTMNAKEWSSRSGSPGRDPASRQGARQQAQHTQSRRQSCWKSQR